MIDPRIDSEALRAAHRNLVVHVGLQIAAFAAHAAAIVWLLAGGLLFDPLAAAPSASRAAIWAWLVVGLVWTPLNARGLWQRRAWARRSTLAYWATPLAWCCCIPLPVWSLVTLTRPAMKRILDER